LKNKIVDIVCLSIVAALFGSVVFLNVFQTNRPTHSALEQRKLAEMPAFSFSALADGSYFADVSKFLSDTFLYRDQLVDLSKKMDTLKGIKYRLSGDDSFVLLDSSVGSNKTEEDDALNDRLNQALENLEKQPTETTPPAPDYLDEPGMVIEPDDGVWETDEEGNEKVPKQDSGLTLSRESLNLTVGSGAAVYVTFDEEAEDRGPLTWTLSAEGIVSFTENENGGINLKALAPGECELICSDEEGRTELCRVTVTELMTVTNDNADVQADFLTSGLFLYGDAVYTQGYYNESVAKSYARTALYYKQLFGEDVNVSVVIAPVSSIELEGTNVQEKLKISDQRAVLDKMEAWMDPSVNFVDTYSELFAHRDEYLYFKSDHHWTQRGAYYAYRAFAKSIGLTPTELDAFDYKIRNEEYHGSLYTLTRDERVKDLVDYVEAFYPTKSHTMTITLANGGTLTRNESIVATHTTYLTFISGDNPYTVINVPDNPQDKNVLVLKDSFGNAFVPYLCEHFGNIIVVDPRHTSMNVYEQLKDYGLTDIVFLNNVQAANSSAWPNMFLTAVGVN